LQVYEVFFYGIIFYCKQFLLSSQQWLICWWWSCSFRKRWKKFYYCWGPCKMDWNNSWWNTYQH